MKKIFRNPLFTFILGGLIFGSIGVFASSILASDVSYNNTTVKTALDTLYTKVKPAYTGDTTFTPDTIGTTFNTKDTILGSNITIDPIPTKYKELTTTTTVTANTLLSGKTAYDNLGNLITGNISTDCIMGSFTPSAGYQISSFNPSFFVVYSNSDSTMRWYNIYDKYWDSSNYFEFNSKLAAVPKKTAVTVGYTLNNGLYLKDWGSHTETTYYIVCK